MISSWTSALGTFTHSRAVFRPSKDQALWPRWQLPGDMFSELTEPLQAARKSPKALTHKIQRPPSPRSAELLRPSFQKAVKKAQLSRSKLGLTEVRRRSAKTAVPGIRKPELALETHFVTLGNSQTSLHVSVPRLKAVGRSK